MTKWLVILAGPNGAGKSTFVSNGTIHKLVDAPAGTVFEVLNPDERAKDLAKGGEVTRDINLQAVQEVEAELYEGVKQGRSVGVETVLSSGKYRKLVQTAKRAGYELMLHYVVLADPSLHVGRVGQRVKQGGHGVDHKKIEDRYFSSLDQMPWFAEEAAEVYIWDNSRVGETPALLAEKNPDTGWSRFDPPHKFHAMVEAAIQKAVDGGSV
jgi:predicted ABC-type ATPase